jgi:hypothetical protein
MPPCSVMGLAHGGTNLHGGGQEGVACSIDGEFHPGTSVFGSQYGSWLWWTSVVSVFAILW